jgi:hypothetical protein
LIQFIPRSVLKEFDKLALHENCCGRHAISTIAQSQLDLQLATFVNAQTVGLEWAQAIAWLSDHVRLARAQFAYVDGVARVQCNIGPINQELEAAERCRRVEGQTSVTLHFDR